MTRTVTTPYQPRVQVPGSKIAEAKRLLRAGKSLSEAAEAVNLPATLLDAALWRTLGFRLEGDR
jgi:hypothetical protein